MVIEDTRSGATPRSMVAKSIPVGQVFTGAIGSYPDRVFLRDYDSVVSLERPDKVWTKLESTHSWVLTIDNYIPRDAKVVLL